MTSKISFPKLVKEDMKKRSWLAALSAVIFIMIIPLSTLFQIEEQVVDLTGTGYEMSEWFTGRVGPENWGVIVAIMLGAIICGVTSFSYLHSKSQVDFYHSLPVKRKTWFAATYVSSFLQMVVPYIIGYLLIVIMGSVKGIAGPKVFSQWPQVLAVNILFFLIIYSVTILAMILTGKLVVAMFGLAVFLFGGSLIGALRIYIMTQNFRTYMSEEEYVGILGNMSIGNMGWRSPIFAYNNMFELYQEGSSLAKPLLIMTVCVVVISLLALKLYQIRPLESAGEAIVFSKLRTVVKVMGSVFAGILFGVIVGSQNRAHGMNSGWLFGIGILATVITYAVIEFIYHSDMRLIFKKRWSLATAVIGTIAIFALIKLDPLGYDTYIPKKDKLEAMAMDYYGENYHWIQSGHYDMEGSRERLKKLRMEEFAPIYELAENGAAQGEYQSGQTVNIAFYLKSGRTVYRRYRVDQKIFEKSMEKLIENKEFCEKLYGFDELKVEKIKGLEFRNFRNDEEQRQLTKEQKAKLLDTYKREVLNQPVATFTKGNIIGEFEFVLDVEYEGYYSGNLYKEFTETIALLEEYGYKVPEKIELEEVEKMSILDYYSEDKSTEITDSVKMKEILERISYHESELTVPNVYVEIEFENGYATSYNLRKE